MHNIFGDTLGALDELVENLVGVTFCLSVVCVGYGVFRQRRWAGIGCIMFAILLPVLAVRDYFRHQVGKIELAFLCAGISLSLYSLTFFTCSLTSFILGLRKGRAPRRP